jgi:hypothetical protein
MTAPATVREARLAAHVAFAALDEAERVELLEDLRRLVVAEACPPGYLCGAIAAAEMAPARRWGRC